MLLNLSKKWLLTFLLIGFSIACSVTDPELITSESEWVPSENNLFIAKVEPIRSLVAGTKQIPNNQIKLDILLADQSLPNEVKILEVEQFMPTMGHGAEKHHKVTSRTELGLANTKGAFLVSKLFFNMPTIGADYWVLNITAEVDGQKDRVTLPVTVEATPKKASDNVEPSNSPTLNCQKSDLRVKSTNSERLLSIQWGGIFASFPTSNQVNLELCRIEFGKYQPADTIKSLNVVPFMVMFEGKDHGNPAHWDYLNYEIKNHQATVNDLRFIMPSHIPSSIPGSDEEFVYGKWTLQITLETESETEYFEVDVPPVYEP